jgi:hypothetical protein
MDNTPAKLLCQGERQQNQQETHSGERPEAQRTSREQNNTKGIGIENDEL